MISARHSNLETELKTCAVSIFFAQLFKDDGRAEHPNEMKSSEGAQKIAISVGNSSGRYINVPRYFTSQTAVIFALSKKWKVAHIDGYAALSIYHTEHNPCSMLRPPTCRAFVQVTRTIYLYLQARKAARTLYVDMHHKFLMHGPARIHCHWWRVG